MLVVVCLSHVIIGERYLCWKCNVKYLLLCFILYRELCFCQNIRRKIGNLRRAFKELMAKNQKLPPHVQVTHDVSILINYSCKKQLDQEFKTWNQALLHLAQWLAFQHIFPILNWELFCYKFNVVKFSTIWYQTCIAVLFVLMVQNETSILVQLLNSLHLLAPHPFNVVQALHCETLSGPEYRGFLKKFYTRSYLTCLSLDYRRTGKILLLP